MKVYVDRSKCEGYVNCVDAAPTVFEMDEEDKAIVLIENPGPELYEAVRKAARLCPVDAIIIEE